MRKKQLLITVVLIAIAFIAFGSLIAYTMYKNSFQKVTITFDSRYAALSLYKSKDSDHPREKQGGMIRSIASGETFTLQNGTYVVELSGININTNPTPLIVHDAPIIQTITVGYTDGYLNQLLNQSRADILQTITTEFKDISSLYTIEPGNLYGRGEWYGTALTYKGADTSNRDTLHIILHNGNGKWEIVTKQPQISLSTLDYKDVPGYILKNTNLYKSAPSQPPPPPVPSYVIDDGSPGAR